MFELQIVIKKNLVLSFVLSLVLFSPTQVAFAKKIKAPKNKFGVTKTSFAGSTFAIASDSLTFAAAKPLVGNTIFYERIIFTHLSIGYHQAPELKRSIQRVSTDSMVTVLESASYNSYNLKFFISNHILGGFKLYAGYGQGNLNLTNSIYTRTATGTVTEETIETSIPLTQVNLGLDLFRTFSNVGLRIEAGQTTGNFSQTKGSQQLDSNFSGIHYNVGFFLLY